jgi:Fe-S cluster biogenesis protein NfuA
VSLARSFVGRVRRGLARRASRLLEELDLQAPASHRQAPAAPRVSPFAASAAVQAPPVTAKPASNDGPRMTFEQVQELFEDMVRPALQSDGGDIELLRVENNDVYVRLQGACTTCASSVVTMRMGIERLLKEEFPHFGELHEVPAGA